MRPDLGIKFGNYIGSILSVMEFCNPSHQSAKFCLSLDQGHRESHLSEFDCCGHASNPAANDYCIVDERNLLLVQRFIQTRFCNRHPNDLFCLLGRALRLLLVNP